jgi:predicted RNase H-like HicB family nuclease
MDDGPQTTDHGQQTKIKSWKQLNENQKFRKQKWDWLQKGAKRKLERLAKGSAVWHFRRMKLTAVFEPAKEGGYSCFVEEVPAAISQGETLAEAKANLLDALKLVLECQRELAEKELSPNALRERLEFAEA